MTTYRRFSYVDFRQVPVTGVFAKTTHAIATAADNQEDYTLVGPNREYFEYIQTGANDAIFPVASATGWKLPLDNTDADGVEVTQGIVTGDPTRMKFVTGTDAFYIKVKIEHTTLANADVFMIGFRELGSYVDITTPALAASVYDDKVIMGVNTNAGAVVSVVSVGGTDYTTTATNTPIVTGTAVTWEIHVSAAGVCTFKVDGTADTLLNASTTNTLATAQTLIPCIYGVATGAGASSLEVVTYECGLE